MSTKPVVVLLDALPDVLTRRDMQRLFQKSTTAFYQLMKDGQVPDPLPMDGHPRWSKEEVRAWLAHRSARRGLRRAS